MAKLALDNIPSDGSEWEQNCLERYDTIINEFSNTIDNIENRKRDTYEQ